MTFAELKALDETYVMHTYGRFPVDIDHGQGATLYSLSGRKYIDFTSGIGVNSLGYGNPKWMAAITEHLAGPAAVHPQRNGQGLFRQLRGGGQRGHDQSGPEVQLR